MDAQQREDISFPVCEAGMLQEWVLNLWAMATSLLEKYFWWSREPLAIKLFLLRLHNCNFAAEW